ncbi:MAG: hypothetical protein FJZ01_16820 [Candidatus Sericytochromatia bacterium]|nr:hypothetical protein [Candidatus Tanganyikabacteria bacterium]
MGLPTRRTVPTCSVLAAIAALASCATRTEQPGAPPVIPPPRAQAPAADPAPVPAPPLARAPGEGFLRTLAGTLPLKQEVSPAPIATYPANRVWRSSGTAGRALLEAWEVADGATSRIGALVFDPASGSIHTLSVETGTRKDTHPAAAGTTAGMALLIWASQGSEGDGQLVGQVIGSGGTVGPRWSYRRGSGQVVGTALAGGKDSYVALWADRRSGAGLTGSGGTGPAAQTVLSAQRLAISGEAIGNPTLVSAYQGQPSQPALAWSGETYLAVWTDTRSATPRILGRILTAAGQAGSPELLVAEAAGAEKPAVAWDGQRFLVTWADGRAGQPGTRDYFVQVVTRTGGLEGANVPVSAYRMSEPAGPARALAAGDMVAVFGGRAMDNGDSAVLAPSSVFATLLAPGASPSAPFALRPLDGARLLDAQPWGKGMVVLAEREAGGVATLDWQYLALPRAGYSGHSGYFGAGNQRNGLQR